MLLPHTMLLPQTNWVPHRMLFPQTMLLPQTIDVPAMVDVVLVPAVMLVEIGVSFESEVAIGVGDTETEGVAVDDVASGIAPQRRLPDQSGLWFHTAV